MNARLALVLLVVSAALVAPVSALAHRAPTSGEATAIKAAVKAYVKNPANHAASDNKVAKILVSTVNTAYAGASLTSVSGNSVALLKRSGSTWKVVGFGSSQKCSLAPGAVRKDLGVTCGQG